MTQVLFFGDLSRKCIVYYSDYCYYCVYSVSWHLLYRNYYHLYSEYPYAQEFYQAVC